MKINFPAKLVVVLLCVIFSLTQKASADAPPTLRQTLKSTQFKIAWDAYHDGNSDIFVMNADGSGVVNLTNTKDANEHYPQISPDGSKICYVVDSGQGRNAVRSVWVMDIDGKNARKIADQAREPFWNPDGKVVGYLPQEFPRFNVTDIDTKGMMFFDLATGKSTPHVNSENFRHLYHPRYSPNGKWIVATVHAAMGFSHSILLVEANGKKIIDLRIPGCRPSISPDGQHIAWGSEDHELDTAPLDTNSDDPKVGKWQLKVLDPENKIYHIAWSPDGKFVSFSRGPDGEGDLSKPGTFQAACEMIGVYATNWNIYAVPAISGVIDLDKANETQLVQLTADGASNKEPCWFTAKAGK